MNKHVSEKNKVEQESQGNLEDLPVDEASQDEVKGGGKEYLHYTITLTNANSC